MLRDCLAAMAQLSGVPMRWKIVLLLAAGEADLRSTEVGGKDLRSLLGRNHSRHLDEALDWLIEHRVISRLPPAGRRAAAYRLRPAEDWLAMPWVGERHDALSRVVFVRAGRIAQEAGFCVPETGALGAFAPPHRGGRRKGVAPPFRGGHKRERPSPLPAGEQIGPPTTHSPDEGAPKAGERGGRERVALTDRQRELKEAFELGTGRGVWGRPLRALVALEQRSNGAFPELVRIAADLAGPSLFADRLTLMEVHLARSEVDERQEQKLEATAERQRLIVELSDAEDEARAGGVEAAERARLLRQRLGTLSEHAE